MVVGPKFPSDGLMPFAFWNLARALMVEGPKYVVSCPVEPLPDAATVYPWELRNIWRYMMSGSDVSVCMVWVKVKEAGMEEKVTGAETVCTGVDATGTVGTTTCN